MSNGLHIQRSIQLPLTLPFLQLDRKKSGLTCKQVFCARKSCRGRTITKQNCCNCKTLVEDVVCNVYVVHRHLTFMSKSIQWINVPIFFLFRTFQTIQRLLVCSNSNSFKIAKRIHSNFFLSFLPFELSNPHRYFSRQFSKSEIQLIILSEKRRKFDRLSCIFENWFFPDI